MAKGTEENFDNLLASYGKIVKQYESGEIKHVKYTEQLEYIFANFGWSKPEFNKELNARLGIQTNESRAANKAPKKLKKKKKTAIPSK